MRNDEADETAAEEHIPMPRKTSREARRRGRYGNHVRGKRGYRGERGRAAGRSAANGTGTQAGPVRRRLEALAGSSPTFAKALGLWDRRPKLSFLLYSLVWVCVSFASIIFLQWSVLLPFNYDDSVDSTIRLSNSIPGRVVRYVAKTWVEGNPVAFVSLAIMMLLYLILVLLVNRFWIATALFAVPVIALGVAMHIKMQVRTEPVIPSDLSFFSGGTGGAILSFIPQDSMGLVHRGIKLIALTIVACVLLQILDRRTCVIPFSWRQPLRDRKTIAGNCSRVLALILSCSTMFSFVWNIGNPGTWAYEWAKSMGDAPAMWTIDTDYRFNGTVLGFTRLIHAKTMDKPDGYSKEAMQALADKYSQSADVTNQSRAHEFTDSTVIMVLSESFSDPTRAPGVSFSEDPMPNIRAIKDKTTGGLMLSSGYGGGTANIEYQTLTGHDMALFDDSMQSPYQQLVPHQKNPYSFNQIWNDRFGTAGSVAVHPGYKSMYMRAANYKKFGFSKFLALDTDPAVTHQDKIDSAPEVSDAATYQNVLDILNDGTDHTRFIQALTIQNHNPYNDWYKDNQFKQADTSALAGDERTKVDTYAKGVSISDQATADFLGKLDQIDRPITVIFYGDHLPGIYDTANADSNNLVALHETDYFIWSNKASVSAGAKLEASNEDYSSPNFFMAQASEHMGAKVSPYLELLSELHGAVPSMARLGSAFGVYDINASSTYVDVHGKVINPDTLSADARQLLEDYRLAQYDMTAGKGYLRDMGFFKVG